MTDATFWTIIGTLGGAIVCAIAFAGFWMNISNRISEAKASADAAKAEADSAGLRAVQANLKVDTVQTSLADFKVYAEREFVSREDLKAISDHHTSQFNDLRGDLKGITQRLDRLLDNGERTR